MPTDTYFYCPECGTYLDARMGSAPTMADIGPPMIGCHRCGTVVASGAKEWAHMTTAERTVLWTHFWGVETFVWLFYGGMAGVLFVAGFSYIFGFPLDLSYHSRPLDSRDWAVFLAAAVVGFVG